MGFGVRVPDSEFRILVAETVMVQGWAVDVLLVLGLGHPPAPRSYVKTVLI